jgi:uncharacterized coiled-coil protein SlyX
MNSKYGRTCICLFVVISAGFGQNVETMKTLIKLRSKTDSLEQKFNKQDSILQEMNDKLAETEKKAQQLDSALVEVTGQIHRQFGLPAMVDQGFTIGVGATMILQGTNAPNALSSGNKRIADASYSMDLTFLKKFPNVGSRVFLHCEAAAGNGLDEGLRLFSGVNFDAVGRQGVQVSEAWYEQTFIADKLTGVIGLMDPSLYFDCNLAANDETVQFLSQIFVINPTIEYPSFVSGGFYAPGLLLHADPFTGVHFTGAVFDANQDWERIGDNLFSIGELSISPKIAGFQGHYRFYGWFNRMPHPRWNNPLDTNENSHGFGISFDQQCADVLTLFVRFGWRDPHNYTLNVSSAPIAMSWSAGVQIGGKPWYRENDAAGIAVGQALQSRDYAAANPDLHAKAETHCEAYYRIQCFDKMSISPDIQYILDPFGGDAPLTAKNVPVFGIRSEVDF